MINARYKKLTGMHAGHTYVVTGPANEIDNPMTWTWAQHKVADSIPLNEKGQANGLVKLSELNDETGFIPFENGVFNGKAMRYTAANILAET